MYAERGGEAGRFACLHACCLDANGGEGVFVSRNRTARDEQIGDAFRLKAAERDVGGDFRIVENLSVAAWQMDVNRMAGAGDGICKSRRLKIFRSCQDMFPFDSAALADACHRRD